MTPEQFRKLGEALYGPRWQSSVALALGVTPRTVRRWAAGQSRSKGVDLDLMTLAAYRLTEINSAMTAAKATADGSAEP